MQQFQGRRRWKTAQSSAGNNSANPSQARRHCTALSQDGKECLTPLREPSHDFCLPHHREYKKLYSQYKNAEGHHGRFTGELDLEQKKKKVEWGRKTLGLRNEVNRRFFSENGKNRGHIQRILKLETDIKTLETDIVTLQHTINSEVDHSNSTPQSENIEPNDRGTAGELVYRSLLSPEVPMSALDHLPADHPCKLMKQEMFDITGGLVTRLYGIVPSLNDSAAMLEEPGIEGGREPDKGDHVIRFVFREFLLWKADTKILARANEGESIDTFLRRCLPTELGDYIKFFEEFGRADTLHFLRDAVCDYLLPPGASSTVILGGPVATEDTQRRMTVEGWDILYTYFSDVVFWWNVEQFCLRAEDLSLIKALVALHRYSAASDGIPDWLNTDDDVSQECSLAVVRGFVCDTKGYADPLPITTKDGVSTEIHRRCYVAGRMAKNEPLANGLVQELVNRVVRFITVIRDRESDETISQSVETEENPWIKRTRSVAVGENHQEAP